MILCRGVFYDNSDKPLILLHIDPHQYLLPSFAYPSVLDLGGFDEQEDNRMLEYAVFVLIALLLSVTSIWLYRLVFGRQGYKHIFLDRNNQTVGKKITTQFGYISPFSAHWKEKQNRRLRNLKGGSKAPWGW